MRYNVTDYKSWWAQGAAKIGPAPWLVAHLAYSRDMAHALSNASPLDLHDFNFKGKLSELPRCRTLLESSLPSLLGSTGNSVSQQQ
eukprot:gene3853-13915_t